MVPPITRRRSIAISAAAAGLTLLPFSRRAGAETFVTTWRGIALGAVATMIIHHPDRSAAARLVSRAVAELRRLESLFSLYRTDSALVELNRSGVLAAPASELVELVRTSQRYTELTRGTFDISVQPLWTLFAGHFGRPDADPAGPPAALRAEALRKVGSDAVLVSPDRIALAKRGMCLTLNGIAQGYITDRVVDLLRHEGIEHTLVDMGETRCIGGRTAAEPWTVGIADPDDPQRIRDRLTVADRAVATSGAYGFRFDPGGRFNHLFDPRSGECAHGYASVTVVADTATAADALSTGFSLMKRPEIQAIVAADPRLDVYVIRPDRSGIERV